MNLFTTWMVHREHNKREWEVHRHYGQRIESIYDQWDSEREYYVELVKDKTLKYANKDKTKDSAGWVLDFQFIRDIQERIESERYELDLEDIELVLLTAFNEEHLLKQESSKITEIDEEGEKD